MNHCFGRTSRALASLSHSSRLPALQLAGVAFALTGFVPLAVGSNVGGPACPDGTTPISQVQSACFPSDCTSTSQLDWGVLAPEVLSLPQFDPGLGTLLEATLVAKVRFNGSLCADNAQNTCCAIDIKPRVLVGVDANPPLPGVNSFVVDVSVTLFSPGFLLGDSDGINDCLVPTGPVSAGDCTPGADHFLANWDQQYQSNSTVLTTPGELAPWIGPVGGPPGLITFDARGLGLINGGSCLSLDLLIRSYGSVEFEVTYLYCPGAPGSSFCSCSASGPCGNQGGPGEGCANSTGQGAVLAATGTDSLGAADLVLHGTQLPPNKPGLFFQGNSPENGGAGLPFGDGLRCVAGSIVRLEVQSANALGDVSSTVNLAAASGASAGDQRFYQLWYRDGANPPCGSGFNLTNGIALVWNP